MQFKCQYETACKIHTCGTCVFNNECISCTHINDKELDTCLNCEKPPIEELQAELKTVQESNDERIEQRKQRYLDLIKQHDGKYGELTCKLMDMCGKIKLPDLTCYEVKKFYEDIVVNGTHRS